MSVLIKTPKRPAVGVIKTLCLQGISCKDNLLQIVAVQVTAGEQMKLLSLKARRVAARMVGKLKQ